MLTSISFLVLGCKLLYLWCLIIHAYCYFVLFCVDILAWMLTAILFLVCQQFVSYCFCIDVPASMLTAILFPGF